MGVEDGRKECLPGMNISKLRGEDGAFSNYTF